MKHRLLLKWSLLVAVLAAFSLASPVWAFMTFKWFGGAIHERILTDALKPQGFTKSRLKVIADGMNSQDVPLSAKFARAENHSCDNRIKDSWAYINERMDRSAEHAATADKDGASLRKALYEFGEGMHSLQDFYSHSNYLEYLLSKNLPLEPIDWDNVPDGVRTCYYQYSNILNQEVFRSRNVNVDILRKRFPTTVFHSEAEFKKRMIDGSYESALRFSLAPVDFLHLELNKDSAEQLEGRVMAPAHQQSFHQLACHLAKLDTTRQWSRLEQMISKKYPDRAALIIAKLKGQSGS